MGSSDGGHISLFLAVHYPDTFGLVAGQSSSITDLISGPIQNGRTIPVKFYLDVGTYDISVEKFHLLQLNRELRDVPRYTRDTALRMQNITKATAGEAGALIRAIY